MEKIVQLAGFLTKLNAGDNPEELKVKYKELLSTTTLIDLARAEQRLLESGMSTYEFCQLCGKMTALLGDQVAVLRANLAADHPMHRMFLHHQRYIRVLEDLGKLSKAMLKVHPAWAGCQEYLQLAAFAEEIDWIERHMMAEDTVLLPEIEQHGNQELVRILRFHHMDLMRSLKKLKILTGNLNTIEFDELKRQLDSIVQWVVPLGKMHVIIEENVLCPIIGSLIKSKATWDKFLAICNNSDSEAKV